MHLTNLMTRIGLLALSACAGAAALAQSVLPAPIYHWTTIAGRSTIGLEDGVAAFARFNHPDGLAIDPSGNLYVADADNHAIRRISTAGIVSTIAGSPGQPGSADGVGTAARFNRPTRLGIDGSGNLYVADSGNFTVRRITPLGVVTTLAGQSGIRGTADGSAATALFDTIQDLGVDATGRVYLIDHGIRQISGGRVQTVVAGTLADVEPGKAISPAYTLAVDGTGQVYFSAIATLTGHGQQTSRFGYEDGAYYDDLWRIMKRDAAGVVSVFLSQDWQASGPKLPGNTWNVGTMTMDRPGNLRVWLVEDSPATPYLASVSPDGTMQGSDARVVAVTSTGGPDFPTGFSVDASGAVYHTRLSDDAIIRIGLDNRPTVFAGTAWSNLGAEGVGPAARFAGATDLAFDSTGNLWVADVAEMDFTGNNLDSPSAVLRKLDAAGVVTEVIHPNFYWYQSQSDVPQVAADRAGNVFFGQNLPGLRIRQLAPAGSVTDLVNPPMDGLFGLVADRLGTLVAMGTRQIWKLTLAGEWSALAGDANSGGIRDGTGNDARFSALRSIAADHQGDFYVIDSVLTDEGGDAGAFYIRRITSGGAVTTVSSRLTGKPRSLAVDSHGIFFLTCFNPGAVFQINPQGELARIGGAADEDGSLDGVGNAARFASPGAIAVDALDNLYVIDGYGTTIRKGQFVGVGPLITIQPQSAVVAVGSSAQLSVAASGTPAPTYQWHHNGSAIAGATGTALSLSNVRTADAGDYTVVVANSLGSVTSSAATLTVTSASSPPPSNPSGDGASGGGFIGTWFVLALLVLGTARRTLRAR